MPAHARMSAPPVAAAGRPAPGPGLGSGSGSLPGLVLFESGLTGMGCEHTRSATRTRPRPGPLERFKPNRCNLSLGSDPLAPPGAHSSPNSQLKYNINSRKKSAF